MKTVAVLTGATGGLGKAFLQELLQEEALQHQEDEPIEAPKDEVPARTVPESRQRPDNQSIQDIARDGAAISPQWDVDIVAEEAAERHVPPAPELRHRLCRVGVVEVLRIVEAQDLPHADGHVGVGAEVQVDLQHERRHPQPAAKDRDPLQVSQVFREEFRVGGRLICQQQSVHKRAAGVSQQRLFCKPACEAADTVRQLFRSGAPNKEFLRNTVVAYNRSGDALMKQRRI